MKTIATNFKLTALICILLVGLSCSNDDESGPIITTQPDIVDLALVTDDLTSLVAALERADLVSALQADGPFTVFAPTNAAFEAFLTANNFASLEDVPVDLLSQVLLNHVVSEENLSANLATGYLSSLSTAGAGGNILSLRIDTSNGVSINGVSTVIAADVAASNGVIHLVDGVIGLPDIVDHALANSDLSDLVGALTANGNTDFTDALSDDSTDYTVFAPINSAFTSFTNPNNNDLEYILANHVIVGTAAFSSGLVNSYAKTAAENMNDNLSIYINVDNGVVLNGVSTVAIADIVATNGVIHAVDAVIDIPTVVTFAAADPNFSTLVEALTSLTPATDFVSILSRDEGGNGDGINPDFTVFAPTNDAFAMLSAIPAEDVLTQVLLYHVVDEANINSTDLTPNGVTTATSLEGDDISITLPGTSDNIADITDAIGNTDIGIIAVDVQAGNGVIHVVNKVMMPDTTN